MDNITVEDALKTELADCTLQLAHKDGYIEKLKDEMERKLAKKDEEIASKDLEIRSLKRELGRRGETLELLTQAAITTFTTKDAETLYPIGNDKPCICNLCGHHYLEMEDGMHKPCCSATTPDKDLLWEDKLITDWSFFECPFFNIPANVQTQKL